MSFVRGIGSFSTRSRPFASRFSARSSGGQNLRGRAPPPVSDLDRQAVLAGQRALAEIRRRDLGQIGDRQRVAHAGRHVHRAHALGRVRGGDDARVGHEVDRDDVHSDRAVGGEAAGDEAGAVAEQDRVGDLQRLHPAGVRPVQRGLHDRGADDRQRARVFGDQAALAHRLRQCVGVRPAERSGALAAALGELFLHPDLAQLLGAGADRRSAGRADGALGLLDEAVLVQREARLGLDVAPPGARGVQLGLDVQVGLRRRGAGRALEHEPGALARGVRGRDVDDVGVAAGLAQRVQQPRGALAVELERLVERQLERDRGGAVDDDVDVADALEPVVSEIAAHGLHAAAVEALARVARQHLVAQAPLGVAAQEHGHTGVGQLPQHLPEQRPCPGNPRHQ